MDKLRHDAFIAQLNLLKSKYPEFSDPLDNLIKRVEKLKQQAIQSKLQQIKRNK